MDNELALNLIRRGHHGRALEEAIHAHVGQWPFTWQGRNPLHGGGNFNNMGPAERVRINACYMSAALADHFLAHPAQSTGHLVAVFFRSYSSDCQGVLQAATT